MTQSGTSLDAAGPGRRARCTAESHTAMDISMGHLCHRFLATAVTIEMQLRFFRPLAATGRIEGRLLRPGRQIVHLESRLFDEHDKSAAYAVGSWYRTDSVQPTP